MKKTLSLILSMLMLLSVFSITAFAAEAPALKGIECTFDGIKITWSAVEDAVNYVVYRSDSANAEDAVIATTTKTKYVDKSVTEGVTYTYKVTVQVADGSFTTPENAESLSIVYEKPYCDHANAKWVVETAATVFASGVKNKICPTCKEVLGTKVIAQLKPATPKITKVYNGKLGVGIKWEIVDGATRYNIYRRAEGKDWKQIATVKKGSSYTDKTAKSGTTYTYAVKAGNAAGLSGFEKVTIKYLAMPKNIAVANTKNGVKLSWDAVKGATSYKIYCKIADDTEWLLIDTTKKTVYLDEAVWSGEKFTYTVRAVSGKYKSAYDAIGAEIVRLDTPELASAKSNKEGIVFNWEAVEGAKGYNVYRKTGNSSWALIGKVNTAKSTAYLDKSAKKGVTYTYTVRARNNTSLSSYNTKGISCKDRY